MPDDSLWYLIVMGGFGLVLVFVGCFIVPIVSFLCKWRYPPLSEEQQMQLNDAEDPKLQALFQLVEKNSVHVSDIYLNKVDNGEASTRDDSSFRKPPSQSKKSLLSMNKSASRKSSVKDYMLKTLGGTSETKTSEKPLSISERNSFLRAKRNPSAFDSGANNAENNGEHDEEAANTIVDRKKGQEARDHVNDDSVRNEDEEGGPEPFTSHSSLNSRNNSHSCAICLEEYHTHEAHEQVIAATGGCDHYFHMTCMKSLIRSRARRKLYEVVPCPICRLPFFAPISWNMQVSSLSDPRSPQNTANTAITDGVWTNQTETAGNSQLAVSHSTDEAETSTESAFSVPASASLPPSSLISSPRQEMTPPDKKVYGNMTRTRTKATAARNPTEDFNANDSFVITSKTNRSSGDPGTRSKKRKGKGKSQKT